MSLPSKKPSLTVGTAALGQPYGLSNPARQMPAETAAAILDRCWERGIDRIDTAAAYGDAEQRVGSWIKRAGKSPIVVTKAPPLSAFADDDIAGVVNVHIDQSLRHLDRSSLDGYLLHQAEDWRRRPVRRALQNARDKGVLKAIGLSGYEPDRLIDLMAIDPVDVIQVPVSLFDRSAQRCGLLDEARSKGSYVMARSIYLQGLLFMDPATLPSSLHAAAPSLIALRRLAKETGESLGTIALHAVLATDGIGTAVLGFYTAGQVDEAADAFERTIEPAVLAEAHRIAGGLSGDIIDPRLWPAR